jgi:dTDP-4-amino-4,6-dideoxygalactose transaminase
MPDLVSRDMITRLAVNGGIPVRTMPFPDWPVHDENEVEALARVARSGNWWRGAYFTGGAGAPVTHTTEWSRVTRFEEEFSGHHGARFGIAASTGTAALNICVRAAGIGPGDEVIVPPYTFVATATSVLVANAVPVFVDIDPDTYCLDPHKIEEAITDRTRAIIPVHFSGHPADMTRIMEIAEKHGLVVIEDAAHAHGVQWESKMIGSIGHMSIFSFQQSKNMTSGEGGIITTNDEGLAKLCYSYHHCGREEGRPWYEHHRLGENLRLTEFQAAVLLVQLKRLDDQNKTRMQNARYLTSRLADVEGIRPLEVDSRVRKHSHHIFVLRYDSEAFGGVSRETFIEALNAEGIPCSGGYALPLYKNPMFLNRNFYPRGCPVTCPEHGRIVDYAAYADMCPTAERACSREAIWIAHRVLLGTQEDMDDIVDAIEKIREHAAELVR